MLGRFVLDEELISTGSEVCSNICPDHFMEFGLVMAMTLCKVFKDENSININADDTDTIDLINALIQSVSK